MGATGMLGHTLMRVLDETPSIDVSGVARSDATVQRLAPRLRARVKAGFHAEDAASLARVLHETRPDVVVNCIGIVKQLAAAFDPSVVMSVNAEFPHRLVEACSGASARLVHISTDCVFSGRRGAYSEADAPDATDLYGRSKLLGEVDAPHAVTLRTSIIGPELNAANGLLAWFMAQHGELPGYTRAVFSGLPTVELARAIRDHLLALPALRGVYHVAAEAVSKFDLLRLIAEAYAHPVTLRAVDEPVIDRSLDGRRFGTATDFVAAPWPTLVERMRRFG